MSEIIDKVKSSEVFCIMADETKDVSKSEQISFTLMYNYNGSIKESFLHFESTERLDAASLTGKILKSLEYDGAAIMSGKHSGVQARTK